MIYINVMKCYLTTFPLIVLLHKAYKAYVQLELLIL